MNTAAPAIIRSETRVSVVINMVLSAGFFLAAFGTSARPLTLAAPDNFALDFLPQSLAIGFFAALVPALIISRKRRGGRIDGVDSHAALIGTTMVRAIGFAAATGAVGVIVAFVFPLAATQIGYFPALVMKLIYGGALAFLVTPRALRLALVEQRVQ